MKWRLTTAQKIKKNRAVLWKENKINKPLARLSKKKRKKTQNHMWKGEITTDNIEI
jgi:hypothetical protein